MGVNIDDMMACGGGGRSPLWRQMLADMYGIPVSTIKADEGPALGVAILAGVGAGLYPSVEEACDKLIQKNKTQQPIQENHDAYMGYYELYKKLYRDLIGDFKELSKLDK